MSKKFFSWLPVAVMAICMAACQTNDNPRQPTSDPRGDDYSVAAPAEISNSRAMELTASHQKFACNFTGQVAMPGQNTVVSPLSMYNFMAMMANGADGNTLKQIVNILGAKDAKEVIALCRRQLDSFAEIEAPYNAIPMPDLNEEPYVFLDEETKAKILRDLQSACTRTALANAIWFDSSIGKPYKSYIDECQQWLNAEAKTLNFKDPFSPMLINQWVSENTNGLIPEIVPSFGQIITKIVCTNALYLNIKWNKGLTVAGEKMTFHNSDGSTSQLTALTNQDRYVYTQTADAHFINLPLGTLSNEMTYTIILPKADGVDATQIIPLTSHGVNSLTESALIKLTMPEFKIETTLDNLYPTFEEMGMTDAFDKKKANFSRMGAFDFEIFSIAHRASINVCESGIEAAAGTANFWAMSPDPNPRPVEPLTINVDRPFAFRITDNNTGMIHFLGVVNNL